MSRLRSHHLFVPVVVALLFVCTVQAGEVLYVRAAATGANTGLSWTDAFTDLQAALAAASGGEVKEIWVAAGTYRPAGPSGDRAATFRLPSGVGLYGGFAGNETSREQRNIETNVTTLSGDLNGTMGRISPTMVRIAVTWSRSWTHRQLQRSMAW